MKQPKKIVVYQTERMQVVRLGFRDFALFVDQELVSFHDEQFKAEHSGAMILEEQANDIIIHMAAADAVEPTDDQLDEAAYWAEYRHERM